MAKQNLFIAGQPWNGVEQLEIPLSNADGTAASSTKAKFIETSSSKPANAADILTGKEAYVNGAVVQGAMANNGQLNVTLDPGASKNVSNGYYSGGTVSAKAVTTEEKEITVENNTQLRNGVVIEPTSSSYLTKATVTFADDIFDIGDATARPEDIVSGTSAYAYTTTTGYGNEFGYVQGQLQALSTSDQPELFAKKVDDSNAYEYYMGFGFLTNGGTEKRYIKATRVGEETGLYNNIFWLGDSIDSRWIQKNQTIGGITGTGWQIQWKDEASGILSIS